MSEDRRADRPRQVTWGAAFAIGAAALLVLSSYDAMADLRSVDTREDLARALDSATARGLGLSVAQAISAMHVLLLVGAAAAAAAVVFGIHAFRGNVVARGVLSVLAVVVLVCSVAADPLLGVAVALAVTMLWSRPARDWFAGRPVRQGGPPDEPPDGSPGGPPGGSAGSGGGRAWSETGDGSGPADEPDRARPAEPPRSGTEESVPQPPPTPGWGTPVPPVSGQQPAPPASPTQPAWPQTPYPQSSYPPAPPTPPERTPGTIKAAAVLTWVFSGIALISLLVSAIVMATNRQEVIDLIEDQAGYAELGIATDTLIAVMWVIVAVFVVWALLAMVFAAFVWRGHEWARVVLAVSTAVCLLLCFPSLPVSAFHLVASAAVLVLLFSSASNRWFRSRRGGPPPGWGPPPGAHGHQGPSGSQGPAAPPPGRGEPPVW